MNAPALAASSNLTRSFARRRIAPVLIVVSLLLALHDAAGYFRADLLIEAVARAGMAMVAAIIVYAWPSNARYEQQRTLLLWGVIGFSFDLFWQEAYAGSIQAAAMVLKYAGIACGLTSFLALIASFGNGERYRKLRAFTANRLAPVLGVAVFAVGVIHGALWIADCGPAVGRCYVSDALSFSMYRTYFALDSAMRVAIFAAAAAALVSSRENLQRLLLVAVSSAVLAAGTAIDFLARLHPLPGLAVFALQIFDAACTLLFVIGLLVAIGRKTMFDVAFAFSSGVVNTVTFLLLLTIIAGIQLRFGFLPVAFAVLVWFVTAYVLWLCPSGVTTVALRQAGIYVAAMLAFYGIFILVESLTHWKGHDPLADLLGRIWPQAAKRLPSELVGDIGLAAIGVLGLSRLEDGAKEWIAERFTPEEDKPFALIRHFRKGLSLFTEAAELERMLVHMVATNVKAEFSHVFLHHDAQHYEAQASYPESLQQPPEVLVDTLPPDVQGGKCRRQELPSACVPQATIVPTMFAPKRGQLFGFLALGPKRSEHGEDYTHRERKELHELGNDAAAALYELRGRS
ncbi:MAG TPA: hypothetical protein VKT72_05955 [Candidatus Baltobacteraceae bacterium]|nr:hypothetical protein [Candidatus Baltobacteraceae bacterium]